MNDLRTEDDLRAALDELSHGAPEIVDVLPTSADTKQGWRRFGWWAPVAAAAAVIAVAVGVAVGLTHNGRSGPPAIAASPGDLVGVEWQVNTINGDAPGRDLTLRIEPNGTFWQGVGTCTGLEGRLSITATELTVRTARPMYGNCPAIPGEYRQEQHFIRVLQPVFTGHLTWSVDGGRLTLRKQGGPTIVYIRPARPPASKPDHSLSVRIALDRTTAPANGEPISGQLIMSNNTGAPVVITNACNGWYAVGLSNTQVQRYTAGFTPVRCASTKLPIGTTRIAIEVSTTYEECVQPGGSGGRPSVPKCTGPAHNVSPPLPPGRYATTVGFQGLRQPVKKAPLIVVTLLKA